MAQRSAATGMALASRRGLTIGVNVAVLPYPCDCVPGIESTRLPVVAAKRMVDGQQRGWPPEAKNRDAGGTGALGCGGSPTHPISHRLSLHRTKLAPAIRLPCGSQNGEMKSFYLYTAEMPAKVAKHLLKCNPINTFRQTALSLA